MDRRSLLSRGVLLGMMGWSGMSAIAHNLPGGRAYASPLLSAADVATRMETLPNWTTNGQQLTCTFEFSNFVESVAFVNRLVEPAEALGHHPDLQISYNRVTVSLTTHDAGGLTSLDFVVAGAIAQPCPPPSP